MRLTLSVCATMVCTGLIAQAQKPARSMEQLLNSKDPLLRESAAQVLGVRGSLSAVPPLLKLLKNDGNLWVRARAAEALGRMGATDAIRPLRSALEREKKQRVRRMVATALARLGQRAGIEELMWQLKAGTNHAKAEAMAFLVDATGQALGQDTKAWWAYLSRRGHKLFARRPAGADVLQEITARLFAHKPPPWRVVPAVVLSLAATRRAVTPKDLRRMERRQGPIPDGCLLLVRTGWRGAKPPGDRRKLIKGPGLTLAAVHHLLKQAPTLIGVGVDTPVLDARAAAGPPNAGRALLLSKNRIVLEGVANIDRLLETGTRLLLVDKGKKTGGERRVQILAILP